MRPALSHPFERVSARARRRALLASAALAAGMMIALASLDTGLRTEASPHGIVSFEFAGASAPAARMLAAWGETGRARAALCLRLDFVFLVAYATGLALVCAALADRERARGREGIADLGALLAWGQLAAGGLDAIENLALLRVLGGAPSAIAPALAAACAWPKFGLVAGGLLYVVTGAVRSRFSSRPSL